MISSVRIHNTWRSTAVLIYRNWLEHLLHAEAPRRQTSVWRGSLEDVHCRTRTYVKFPGKTGLSAGGGTYSGTATGGGHGCRLGGPSGNSATTRANDHGKSVVNIFHRVASVDNQRLHARRSKASRTLNDS